MVTCLRDVRVLLRAGEQVGVVGSRPSEITSGTPRQLEFVGWMLNDENEDSRLFAAWLESIRLNDARAALLGETTQEQTMSPRARFATHDHPDFFNALENVSWLHLVIVSDSILFDVLKPFFDAHIEVDCLVLCILPFPLLVVGRNTDLVFIKKYNSRRLVLAFLREWNAEQTRAPGAQGTSRNRRPSLSASR